MCLAHSKYSTPAVCTCQVALVDSLQSYGLQPIRFLCPWGLSRQEYWSGLPFPSPEDLPELEMQPVSLMSPAFASGFFTTSATLEV